MIRQHSHAVTAGIKAGTMTSRELIERLQADPMFAGIDVAKELDPMRYVGRSPEQVDEFIEQEVRPVRERYRGGPGAEGRGERLVLVTGGSRLCEPTVQMVDSQSLDPPYKTTHPPDTASSA